MLALQAGLRRVECAAFSPDGSRLAVGGAGLEVWAVPQYRPVWRWPGPEVRSAAFTPDGGWVYGLTPGETGRIYNCGNGTEDVFGFPHSLDRPMCWSADWLTGRILVGSAVRLTCRVRGSPDRGRTLLGPELWTFVPDGLEVGAAVLVPGRSLSIALARQVSRTGPRSANSLIVLNAETGRPEREVRSGYWRADHLTASPGSDRLAGALGATLLVWDLDRPHRPPVRRENDTRRRFTGLAFHPSGRLLATASNDKVVKLWDVETWAVVREFTWGAGRMRSITFSPDGLTAAAGGEEGRFVLFDVDL